MIRMYDSTLNGEYGPCVLALVELLVAVDMSSRLREQQIERQSHWETWIAKQHAEAKELAIENQWKDEQIVDRLAKETVF